MSFRFQKFIVNDSQCAMKVGTDGVLLGAWAGLYENCMLPYRILDVGTGSGLIALMLAQRMPNAYIVGVEIDTQAAQQAAENFMNSPWEERLEAKAVSLQEYVSLENSGFDMIVSNPPYFSRSLKTPDQARTTARHSDSLKLEELVTLSADLLNTDGVLCVVLPVWEEDNMKILSSDSGLTLERVLRVQGRSDKPIKRTLLSFRKKDKKHCDNMVVEENLVLEEGQNKRTKQYAALMSNFYL